MENILYISMNHNELEDKIKVSVTNIIMLG